MRFWLLSNTTYGTWLLGSPRGSVTSVRDRRADDELTRFRFEHDMPGEPWEKSIPGIYRAALEQMKGPPIFLDLTKAELLLAQFLETAAFRHWTILAVSIMRNHFHMVVQVLDDPAPKKVLADFKAYGSRKLNQHYGIPPSETWWTTNGSKRKLEGESHLENAVRYVLYKQPNPLVVYSLELGRIV